jgi:hypothetical protein
MNYLKYLQEYRKATFSDSVIVLYKVVVDDVGEIFKQESLSDSALIEAAQLKGKSTWDEAELCDALGLESV